MATQAVLDNVNIPLQESPLVELDVDEISHQMAARLTSSLLGHWLYMKGQVPFPVNSLERMSSQKYSGDMPPDSRLTFKRKEFLDAYDDLNSHFRTTFVALSTAYAHNEIHAHCSSLTHGEDGHTCNAQPYLPKYRSAKVCLFLAMGPSLSLPKSRVLLELNNFHVEKFGEWDFIRRAIPPPRDNDELSNEEDESPPAEFIDDSDNDESGTEDLDNQRFFSVPSTPCLTASFYTAESDYGSDTGSDPLDDTPSSGSSEHSGIREPNSPETSLSEDGIRMDNHNRQPRFPSSNQEEDEDSLRNGERKLSKALLKFGDVLGFDDELAPTRTYIWLRAPRRFSHPTWVPRQNLTPVMNKAMDSALNVDATAKNKKKVGKSGTFGSGVPASCLRVVCQSSTKNEGLDCEEEAIGDPDADDSDDDRIINEVDELIWWSWDGKLVGFSD